MKKIRIYLLLIISLSLLFSCAEETEIGNDIVDFTSSYKKMPVILSQFSNDSILFVEIRTTEPAFNMDNNSPNTKFENPILKNLENGTSQILKQNPHNAEVYYTNMELTVGTAYQIDVDFPECTEPHISAIDTIPHISKIQSTIFTKEAKKVDNDLLTLVQLEVHPFSISKEMNYEITVVTTITDTLDEMGFPIDTTMIKPTSAYLYSDNPAITQEDYYPSILQFDAFPPTNLYFKMENNSETFLIDFYYSPPMSSSTNMSSGETTTHIYSHTASVSLKTVSSNYYKYHVSRLQQFYSRKGDPLYGVGEPVNVYTNIQNGTGIFASYTCDSINYSYKSE